MGRKLPPEQDRHATPEGRELPGERIRLLVSSWVAALEDHGFVAVEKNSILDVPADRAREHDLFEIPSLLN